jgi:copper(I)-binding protein
MSFPKLVAPALAFALAAGLFALPALASDVQINDAYFRTSSPIAKSGGAFLQIINSGATDDRLIGVASDVAIRVELHRNIDAGGGVMQMREAEDGFLVPAGGMHMLARGGDHLMFMGLTRKINDGDMIEVVFTFENAGEMSVEIPVDLHRQPGDGGQTGQDHGDQAQQSHDG